MDVACDPRKLLQWLFVDAVQTALASYLSWGLLAGLVVDDTAGTGAAETIRNSGEESYLAHHCA